ncbi:MAG: PA14 domain-containing protein [Planctomycetota bacterium]|jgi:hypothetical protein
MWQNASILLVIVSILAFSGQVQAGRDVTRPGDNIIGVPNDGLRIPGDNGFGWPATELPKYIIDDQILTKFLHFKGETEPTGIRVTPSVGPTVVTGISFTTANRREERDPVEWELSGSNDSISGPYTLIASGTIDDFAGETPWPRHTKNDTPIKFANNVEYKHYQLMFPAVRDPEAANSMQISEIELLEPVFKAQDPFPADGSVHADTWAEITWTPGEAAISHDVYISDNRDDVVTGTDAAFVGNQIAANIMVGFPGFPIPEGLTPTTTYYVRVDEINPSNPDSPWIGDVWSFTVPPKIAWQPNPRDGAQFVDPNTDLSWNPGWGARLHTVYFGDDFNDVSNATGATSQMDATFALDTLEAGKTYYWRVDEFDDVADTHTGEVWSFTITTGEGGLKGEYFNNVSLSGTPVFTRIDPEVNFDWGAEGPGAPLPDNGWSARWTADLLTLVDDTYTFDVNSEGGTRLWIDGNKVIDVWASHVPAKYPSQPTPLKAGIHTLRLEYADWDRDALQKLSWSTPTMAEQIIPAGPLQLPMLARQPSPADGVVGVNLASALAWKPGYAAASHDVYFGTDADAVANATKASPEYKGNKPLGEESLDPGSLEFNTAYFWRVDEINDVNPDGPWKGNLWTLNTGEVLVVDDIEGYDDVDPPVGEAGNRIWEKWIDGFGTLDNGAVVGNVLPPYAEKTIVHGGGQSLNMTYDNTGKFSEATLTLVFPTDWTAQGVTKLSLWLMSSPGNDPDRIFVALNGTAVVYNDEPAATQTPIWHEWVIDLAAFNTDLTNVNTITIGVGTKGVAGTASAGTMYFDDIRLIP